MHASVDLSRNHSLSVQNPSGSLEPQMALYNPQQDLSTTKHEELINDLKAKLPYKEKEVRRFPIKIVEQDITHLCDRALHQIQGDVNRFKLQVEQGKTYFEGELKTFDKEESIKAYTEEFQLADADELHVAENELTTYEKEQKAERHLLLKDLNHLTHQTDDYLHETYKGQSPKKHWNND